MANTMTLRSGFMALAVALQEAADKLSANDTRTRLEDAIRDHYRDSGQWGYYLDSIGDDKTGDVIYSCAGDFMKAPYTITTGDGTSKCTIDFAKAKDVVPRTTYEEEIEASPMGEAAKPTAAGLVLIESAAPLEAITLTEGATSKAEYPIKLIAPGKGSSAFYPSEVLKRDGPKVFKAGTHVYLNHQTAAEEAARPEGDVKNLAGVLTSDAVYHESHPKGEGLYGSMKVFADHAPMLEGKAPYVGMSIRAAGIAEAGKRKDGLPVLKEFTDVHSVDVVTRAGAGGMILTESARAAGSDPQPINEEKNSMDAAEAKKLIESAVSAAVGPLHRQLAIATAREEVRSLLEAVSLPAAAKTRIVEAVTVNVTLTDAGELDVAKFREAVVAAAKAEGEYLASVMGRNPVQGMGTAPVAPKQLTEAEKAEAYKRDVEESVKIFESLGMPTDAASKAATFEVRG